MTFILYVICILDKVHHVVRLLASASFFTTAMSIIFIVGTQWAAAIDFTDVPKWKEPLGRLFRRCFKYSLIVLLVFGVIYMLCPTTKEGALIYFGPRLMEGQLGSTVESVLESLVESAQRKLDVIEQE